MKNLYRRSAAGIMSFALALSSAGYISAPSAVKAAGKGVSINEVCPKNSTFAAPDGGMYDYIELYNSSDSYVDISGWGISDKASKPYRFTFAAGTGLAAGQRLILFCDGDAGKTNNTIAPFGLSADGETVTLTDTNGNAVSTAEFSALAENSSYGQYPDGSGDFFVMCTSPNAANAAPEGSDAVKLPQFSAESGFYDSEFQLTINAPQGTTVYYTTDGSDPTQESEKYSGAIRIKDCTSNPNVLSARTDISASQVTAPKDLVDKAMVVRAVAVDSQGRTSNIVTKTYFVGTTNNSYYKNMKVISLVTDPDNLFDYEKGIYVTGKVYDDLYKTQQNPQQPQNPQNPQQPQNPWGGGFDFGNWGGWGMIDPWAMEANYTQHGKDWERPASVEMFVNGESVLAQDIGIRIKGAASRSSAQKSFNLYTRADYGSTEFAYDFFDGKATKKKNGKVIDKFDGITIRNGGNDVSYAFFRDSINQALVTDRNMAVQSTSECMVFIDGEFWGIYQLMERVSDDFLKSHFGINKDDAVIIKNGEVEEGTDQNLSEWNDFVSFCAGNDMSNAQNYQKVCQQLDIQSYIDYFASQIYWSNGDWPQNNVAAWKTSVVDESNPYSDGKWRMFLFDTEYSSGLYNKSETMASSNAFQRISRNYDNMSRMFTNLLKNSDFKAQFVRTMMDLAYYNFSTDSQGKVFDTINYYKENFREQIIDTFERYSVSKPEQQFENEYRTIENFFSSRTQNIEQHLKSSLGLTGNQYAVTINNQNYSKGTVHVNTLTIGEQFRNWTGKYFSDYDITVSAEPKDGYRFVRWECEGAAPSGVDLSSDTLTLKLASAISLTPVFAQDDSSVRGDFNGDSKMNVADVVVLQKFLIGDDVSISKNDMDGDGKITSFDLALLRSELI